MKATAVMELSKDILEIVRQIAESETMINPKTGKNTIAPDSDLYKAIQVQATSDGDLVYDIILNGYIQYIENGRRPNGKFPPVEPIIRWARKHGIPDDNSTIFLIRRAIARDGIKPRPMMEKVFDTIDTRWDGDMADKVFEAIIEVINDFFNQ